jgi:hypothetical protein
VQSSLATHLGSGASKIRTKHDDPRSLIREFPGARLETVFKKLDVTTTTVATLLILDFVLNDQRFVLEVQGSFQWSRDGVMGSLALGDQTRVALDDWGGGFLDLPLTDIAKCLSTDGGLLGGL